MKKYIPNIILVICCITAIISTSYICNYYYENNVAQKTYSQIENENIQINQENLNINNVQTIEINNIDTPNVIEIVDNEIIQPIKYKEIVSLGINWKDYKKYPEMIGWIQIQNNEYINFPIMQHEDNNYYLSHLYDGQQNSLGSVFLDRRNTWFDKHIIIYGHNFRNTNMFSTLTNYQQEDYANEHRYVYIETLDGKTHLYYVFSCYITQVFGEDDGFVAYNFDTENEDYDNWLQTIKNKSLISSEISPTNNDKILTLSTCTGNGDKLSRCIIHCVEIENKIEISEN